MDKYGKNVKVSGPSGKLKNSARPLSGSVLVISKAQRQANFIASCEGMSSSEASKKASLFGDINPSDFRILHMVG